VRIFASGGLDEYAISELVAAKAPIDAFGVGTRMGVSSDAPDLDIAYKLTEYAGEGRLKLSAGKAVLPGRKQVFRTFEGGVATADVIARPGEQLSGEPLLQPVMRAGVRLPAGRVQLEEAHQRARRAIRSLPPQVRSIAQTDRPYPVRVSEALARYGEEVKGAIGRRNRAAP
jgi:nicotinate phosphoribosyltransferase